MHYLKLWFTTIIFCIKFNHSNGNHSFKGHSAFLEVTFTWYDCRKKHLWIPFCKVNDGILKTKVDSVLIALFFLNTIVCIHSQMLNNFRSVSAFPCLPMLIWVSSHCKFCHQKIFFERNSSGGKLEPTLCSETPNPRYKRTLHNTVRQIEAPFLIRVVRAWDTMQPSYSVYWGGRRRTKSISGYVLVPKQSKTRKDV